MEREDSPDLVGATLPGGWRIVRHIGEGAMAHVYEACTPEGSRVAVKVLHASLLHKPDVAFRFRREAELVASIDSPHIPKLLGRGRDPRGRFFQVLELAPGEPLTAILARRSTLSMSQALDIGAQVGRALQAAHAAGIVHRDVKPDNVIVDGMPDTVRAMVLDFSISKDQDLSFTQTGVVLGTPSYMAPDQARGEVTPLVDVYGVGAILYDMLTGRPPFTGTEPGKVLAAVLTESPPRPCELAPHLSPAVEAVILRAIARDPKDRYPTIGALVEALERLQSEANRRSFISTFPPPATPSLSEDDPAAPATPSLSEDDPAAPSERAPRRSPSRRTLVSWVVCLVAVALALVLLILGIGRS